jgi:hypothetical protein
MKISMFPLFIIFLILKLCNVIAWSWVWVTAPIWIPLALVFLVMACIGVVGLVIHLSKD